MKYKIKILVFVLIFPVLVVAYPSINDIATYKSTLHTNSGDGFVSDIKRTILDFDSNRNLYLIRTEVENSDISREKWVPSSRVYKKNDVLEILRNCEKNDGKRETILVPAGLISTCYLKGDSNDNHIWIADVVFGYAKKITYDSVVELKSYNR